MFNQEECVLLPTSDVDLTTETWDSNFIYPLCEFAKAPEVNGLQIVFPRHVRMS